jgi:quercetin dioxygenase-like cupin family protein
MGLRNKGIVLTLVISLLFSGRIAAAESTPTVQISRVGSQPSSIGSSDNFVGRVQIDSPFRGSGPSRIFGATVTFAAGACTAWHSHAFGQTLIVTSGAGRVQQWGGPVQEIHPGDIVWIPPGVKHWHGASEKIGMTHIAIVEDEGGKSTVWMEKQKTCN